MPQEHELMYVGTKIVRAWPEEKDGKPGYAVTYKDGYKSWSPKEAFEEAYRPLNSMMPKFGLQAGQTGQACGASAGQTEVGAAKNEGYVAESESKPQPE